MLENRPVAASLRGNWDGFVQKRLSQTGAWHHLGTAGFLFASGY